ncbi:acyl-CoA thioesterase [Gordonia rhizosphera]|uniref:acyl-CoA thioesterase n=1 Tax=Gordonia rhizosphera TaxID=83341 RepID=UPI0012F6CF00|nr:acyl-CoA thioesterase domain-containing protein [Gordonia rhizosphera]
MQIADILDLVAVRQIGESVFLGSPTRYSLPRVFGGQVVGQALTAASATTPPDWPVHSVQTQFLRPGSPDLPIRFAVERNRDGGSFASRTINACQGDRQILAARASYHRPETGFEHQLAAPAVPSPHDLPSWVELYESDPDAWPTFYLEWEPLDVRIVPQSQVSAAPTSTGLGSRTQVWMRSKRTLRTDDQNTNRALLACVSDLLLLSASVLPHGVLPSHKAVQMASLDHCVWFHRPFRMDEWLLYDHMSPSSHGGLGLARGEFYTDDGRHVASVVQEGLIRSRE